MQKKLGVLIVILIICSLFMPISVNYTGQSKLLNSNKLDRYVSLSRLEQVSTQNIIYRDKSKIGFEFKYELGLYEGVTNGVVIFGNYFRNIFVGTLLDYLNGFSSKSSEMKMVWLFFGIFLEIFKNILLSSLEFIAVAFILLLQSLGSYTYILSYIFTMLFIIGIAYVLQKQ